VGQLSSKDMGTKWKILNYKKSGFFFPDEILTIHSYYFHSKSG